MLSLMEKLNSINSPTLGKLPTGRAFSIEELWDKLIERYLPNKEVVLRWNDLLLKYISSSEPVFCIRGYNTTAPNNYGELRRGFLTQTDKKYSFFYSDNFFAAYFQKMAIDGFVPSLCEFYDSFKKRLFPSRFMRNTAEERELLAMPQGKDPGINSAGWKLAHIIPVGKDYCIDNECFGMSSILREYFPKGQRNEWKMKNDSNGMYHERYLEVPAISKKIIVAHYLRFVDPLNYFLAPKKTCEKNDKCTEIAEYEQLLNFAQEYNRNKYKEVYDDYLKLLLYKPLDIKKKADVSIKIEYGIDVAKNNKNIHFENGFSNANKPIASILIKNDCDINLSMAWEYLNNPKASFRKLEKQFLHIDSPSKGGGFKAKAIINGLGILAEKKGVLSIEDIDVEILQANGNYLNTLNALKLRLNHKK